MVNTQSLPHRTAWNSYISEISSITILLSCVPCPGLSIAVWCLGDGCSGCGCGAMVVGMVVAIIAAAARPTWEDTLPRWGAMGWPRDNNEVMCSWLTKLVLAQLLNSSPTLGVKESVSLARLIEKSGGEEGGAQSVLVSSSQPTCVSCIPYPSCACWLSCECWYRCGGSQTLGHWQVWIRGSMSWST